MIRFHNSEINLKSSVYNLAGENYFEQLSAYNSMRFHIRRILLAKSVVDSRNKKYINNKKRQLKVQLSRRYSLDNLIDQLAFDTKHHPVDMLRMNLNKYSSYCVEEENSDIYPCNIDNIDFQEMKMQATDTETNDQNTYQNHSISKSKKISQDQQKTNGKKHIKDSSSRKHRQHFQCIIQRKCRCDEKPIYITCQNPFNSPINLHHSDSDTSSNSITHEDHASSSLSSPIQIYACKRADLQAKEDARYTKFAYEITKEIIKSGIYTDKELNEIFKKHLKRYRNTLDLHRMLKEIYQLKIFLNISEESDESDNDNIELLNTNEIRQHEIRPPTPPKVLDENKVIGKLLSYQKLMEIQCNKEPRQRKSVILIDANPELLITERDVLTSLLEVGIDPKQAENICKSLHQKSMETILDNMAELNIETLPNKSDANLQTESTNCAENCNEDFTHKEILVEVNNKSSTTDDLSSKQDEIIQTLRSPVTLLNDNYTEPMCSTFSRLHQEEHLPSNVADEVTQTEVQINVGSRKNTNKSGVHITEIYEEKKRIINENMQVPSIAQTDILAWSREKLAEIKANTSNDIEIPMEKNDYEYRIPITKSTEELLSNNKGKKNTKNPHINEQAKLTNPTKKFKKETNPSKPENPKAVDNKPIKRNFNKSTRGVSQKKNPDSNKSVPNPNKTKNTKGKEKINESIQKVSTSTCISSTCGICITKLNMHRRENSKCITNDEKFENLCIRQENEEEQDEINMNESELNKYESVVNEEIQTSLNQTKKNNKKKL
ncbi:uncharacterized protein LOC122633061 isoform X1 [Vespula pensylvanica]|uniref:uncharacterized protein LOC122633061 isoform X1 n=3 Tax=Vespula pensylvanica TaxID=30213 RepID=UPI001CBA0999|nr:uncharacterized protein LOC122633061 isoform X1 [Vespula pensylvanica]